MIARIFGPRAKRPRPHVAVEYWIYTSEAKLPPQEVLLARLMRSSPFDQAEQKALGPEHGLLFSDIRLHMAMATRDKNAHLFRPDLFESHVEPSQENIEDLAAAKAMARVRFNSEQPVGDRRYLKLMPYLVEAIAYYARANTAFDLIAERLFSVESLRTQLRASQGAEGASFHIRAAWIPSEVGGKGVTRGLAKLGLPELETPESPAEERTVVTGVLDEAACRFWEAGEVPDDADIAFMGGSFRVRVEPGKRSPLLTHILRVNEA